MRNEQRDFSEWHRGRAPYVFWGLLLVDCPALRLPLAQAAAWLDGLLLDGYVREPHVTLDVCGFPSSFPAEADEFARDLIDGQITRLASGPGPFSIRVGTLDSFTSAPLLTVFDVDRGIADIRECLAETGRHRLFGEYVPHVTVGLYRDAWPLPEIAARLAACTMTDDLVIPINQVDLLAYAPSVIGGALTRLGSFDLASRRMQWMAAAKTQLPGDLPRISTVTP